MAVAACSATASVAAAAAGTRGLRDDHESLGPSARAAFTPFNGLHALPSQPSRSPPSLCPPAPASRPGQPRESGPLESARGLTVVAKQRGTQRIAKTQRGTTSNVRGTKRGTQILPRKGRAEEPQPSRGTLIFRRRDSAQAETAQQDGAAAAPARPEELPASPGPFYAVARLASLLLGPGAPDAKTVFVAGGAAGPTASRVVAELLAAGFKVRAGAEDADKGAMKQLLAQLKPLVSAGDAKRLTLVQYSARDPDFTAQAMAGAGTVVVTLGRAENGAGSAGVVSPQDALDLLRAAEAARASQFVLLTDFAQGSGARDGTVVSAMLAFLGSIGRRGVSYAGLATALAESEVSYSIVRTGFCDGVPDSLMARSNLVVAAEGSINSGKISRAQVAQLVAALLSDPKMARDKALDVVASEAAQPTPLADMLSLVPPDPRRANRLLAAEQEEQEAAAAVAREAAGREAAERAVQAEALARAAEEKAAAEAMAAKAAREAAEAAKAQVNSQVATAAVSDMVGFLKGTSSDLPPAKAVLPSFASLVPKAATALDTSQQGPSDAPAKKPTLPSFTSLVPKAASPPGSAQDTSPEVPSPKTALPSFSSLVPKIPAITPSPAAAAAASAANASPGGPSIAAAAAAVTGVVASAVGIVGGGQGGTMRGTAGSAATAAALAAAGLASKQRRPLKQREGGQGKSGRKAGEAAGEKKTGLGGLWQQETVFVDSTDAGDF
ncbi:hypothetical protein CLOM_g1983 [Closterium sp. NIES-68]|nr:hypothetical protein CLOM_g1983 [Closterium sp. NIES-68]GJP84535.1 hypothetical protein CLOP_g14596 [Closterium sp. NIES-67]